MFNIRSARMAALAALAAAMAVSAAVPAHAQTVTKSIAVRYSDLDLGTDKGRKTLEQRLDRAARKVCGMKEHAVGTRLPSRSATACLADARVSLDRQFAKLLESQRRGG